MLRGHVDIVGHRAEHLLFVTCAQTVENFAGTRHTRAQLDTSLSELRNGRFSIHQFLAEFLEVCGLAVELVIRYTTGGDNLQQDTAALDFVGYGAVVKPLAKGECALERGLRVLQCVVEAADAFGAELSASEVELGVGLANGLIGTDNLIVRKNIERAGAQRVQRRDIPGVDVAATSNLFLVALLLIATTHGPGGATDNGGTTEAGAERPPTGGAAATACLGDGSFARSSPVVVL